MDTILLTVTIGAVLAALVMGAVAWRVSRKERARSAARVAALAAAATSARPAALEEFDTEASTAPARTAHAPSAARGVPDGPVTQPEAASVTIDPRPARPARVSAFTPTRSLAATASRVPGFEPDESEPGRPPRPAAPLADSFLEGGTPRASEGRQRGLAMAAAILFVVLGGGGYWLISGKTSATGGAAAPSASTAPLELMSLRHERVGSRLSLSGLVRNPATGAAVEGLMAVVFLFDAQGSFVTSARAGVDFTRLSPGDESPFVINVDAPSNVARYRVSFRTDAGVLTHVDRRAEQPATTALAGKS